MSAFPRDWQPTAASLTRLTHDLTGVQMTVRIYPPGAIRMLERPAVWRASSRRLFIDATGARLPAVTAGVEVDGVAGRLREPALTGLVTAATVTAAGSVWRDELPADHDPRVAAASHLDQIRAESLLANTDPVAQVTMRAAAPMIIDLDFDERRADLMWLITELLPRVDALVFPARAGISAKAIATEVIGKEGVGRFVAVWRSAFALDDNDTAGWLEVGARWMRCIDALPRDVTGLGAEQVAAVRADLDAVADAAAAEAEAAIAVFDAGAAETPRLEWGDLADAALGGFAGAGIGLPRHRRIGYREPSDGDRTARTVFEQRLRDASHKAPGMTKAPVPYPAGRLNSRELVRRSAQISLGLPVTAKPWTTTIPSPRVDPKLSFIMVIDTSLTMAQWAAHAAPLGWAVASAVHALGGTCAVWGFGGEAFQVIKAGTAPANVPTVIDSGSGSDGCHLALDQAAADSAILGAAGTRVAVILTDGKLPRQDWAAITKSVARLHQGGVLVLWVLPSTRVDADFIPQHAVTLTNVHPDTFAASVGAAAISAMDGTGR